MYEVFQLDSLKESCEDVFTEAVFTGGKNRVKPIEKHFEKVKTILENEIKEKGDKFDSKAYWKNQAFKELENSLNEAFGFRLVSIHPYREKWVSKEKQFESKEMNACVYSTNRFPIDGLVTAKGFYDSTHSIVMDIYVSLGLIKALTPAELTAVLLHEFGHSIDPALVDITYTETNILSKYLTDRQKEVTKAEKRAMSEERKNNKFAGFVTFVTKVLPDLTKNSIISIFTPQKKVEKKALEDIANQIKKDKTKFDRQHAAEAFADNYARMYGYAPDLARALNKMDKHTDTVVNNRYQKEKIRRNAIIAITKSMLTDVHKTDIHRIRALINEYHKDINDPNVSPAVKKQMEEDVKELEKILDEYLNNRGELKNRINQLINDELKAREDAMPKALKESLDLEEALFEAKKDDVFNAIRTVCSIVSNNDSSVITDVNSLIENPDKFYDDNVKENDESGDEIFRTIYGVYPAEKSSKEFLLETPQLILQYYHYTFSTDHHCSLDDFIEFFSNLSQVNSNKIDIKREWFNEKDDIYKWILTLDENLDGFKIADVDVIGDELYPTIISADKEDEFISAHKFMQSINDSNEPLTESKSPEDIEIDKIISNIKESTKIMQNEFKEKLKDLTKSYNKDAGLFNRIGFLQSSVLIGDKEKYYDWGFGTSTKHRIRNVVKKAMKSNSEENIYVYFIMKLTKNTKLKDDEKKKLMDLINSKLRPFFDKYINKDWIDEVPANYYYSYVEYDFSFRYILSEGAISKGINLDVFNEMRELNKHHNDVNETKKEVSNDKKQPDGFKNIKPEEGTTYQQAKDFWDELFSTPMD